MKTVLLFLLLSSNVFSGNTGPLLIKKPEPKINNAILQYRPAKASDGVFAFVPLQKIKITIKAGMNGSTLEKDVKDSFNDTEPVDALAILKYDTRLKIYLSKRWRIIMRAQFLGTNKDIYTLGFVWKV